MFSSYLIKLTVKPHTKGVALNDENPSFPLYLAVPKRGKKGGGVWIVDRQHDLDHQKVSVCI